MIQSAVCRSNVKWKRETNERGKSKIFYVCSHPMPMNVRSISFAVKTQRQKSNETTATSLCVIFIFTVDANEWISIEWRLFYCLKKKNYKMKMIQRRTVGRCCHCWWSLCVPLNAQYEFYSEAAGQNVK